MSVNIYSSRLRALARKILPDRVRRVMLRWFNLSRNSEPVSTDYEVITKSTAPTYLLQGWADPAIPERQHKAFAPLLRQMHAGNPREDFVAEAIAVQRTGLANPLIIEVGCGSGWNSEVLTHLLRRPVRYIGVDYSPAMTALGQQCYPDVPFVVGDALALPFQDGVCDILLSGTVLMHLLGYRAAIQESRRVAQKWCIFHTVPVLERRETTVLRKKAYGQPAIEVVLNEGKLYDLLERNELVVRHVMDSLPYNLATVLGEPTVTKTYLCEVR